MNTCTYINKKTQMRQMRENKKERGLVRFSEKIQVYKSEEHLHNSPKWTAVTHHRLQQVTAWFPLSAVCSTVAAPHDWPTPDTF